MASSNADTSSSGMDTVKLLLALVILALGVVGFYYYSDQSNLYRVLGLLAAAAVAIGIAATSNRGRTLLGFMKNARTEVRKMVWPTRQEAFQTTLIVMVLVVIVGIFLFFVDKLLGWVVKLLLGGG